MCLQSQCFDGTAMEACGWYLCAALHSNPLETWLARRLVGVNEDSRHAMAQVKESVCR